MVKKMKVFLELWSSRSFFFVSSTSSYSKAFEFVISILNTTAKWIRNRLTEINMISPILDMFGEATQKRTKTKDFYNSCVFYPVLKKHVMNQINFFWVVERSNHPRVVQPRFPNILDNLSNKNHWTEVWLAASTNCRLNRLESGTSNPTLAQNGTSRGSSLQMRRRLSPDHHKGCKKRHQIQIASPFTNENCHHGGSNCQK